jgi:hypothetical protein
MFRRDDAITAPPRFMMLSPLLRIDIVPDQADIEPNK